ncbi:MAG: tetratricopeptide repeat protein [Candidatus Eremiobacteraeota bacterium]|nr:tetratricopeptide repeat protein [Candidatus Eremiobacteraeota bacterium]
MLHSEVTTVAGNPQQDGEKTKRLRAAKRLSHEQKHSEAMALLEQVLATDPDNGDALMERGQIHEAQGRPDLAAEAYKKLLLYNPDYPGALRRLVPLMESAGEEEKRGEFYESLLAHGSLSSRKTRIELLRALAGVYRAKGSQGALAEILEKLLSVTPNDAIVLLELSSLFISIERTDQEALAVMEKALKLRPEQRSLIKHLAKTYRTLNVRTRQAMMLLKKHYELEPHDDENTRFLASVIMELDCAGEPFAGAVLDRALERKLLPRGPLMYHLGLVKEFARDHEGAFSHFEEAAKEGYDEAGHYPSLKLGQFWKARKESEKADRFFREHLRRHPDEQIGLRELRGSIGRLIGDGETRPDDLRLLLTQYEKNPVAKDLVILGETFLNDHGLADEALRCFNRAIEKKNDSKEAYLGKAGCLEKQGNWDEAARTYEKLLSLRLAAQERDGCLMSLARIHFERLGNLPKAKGYVSALLSSNPAHEEAMALNMAILGKEAGGAPPEDAIITMWKQQPLNEGLLERMKGFCGERGNQSLLYRFREMEAAYKATSMAGVMETDFSTGLEKLALDDYVHSEERRFIDLIHKVAGDRELVPAESHQERQEFQELLRQSTEVSQKDLYSLPTPLFDALSFFSGFPITLYRYEGMRPFRFFSYEILEKPRVKHILIYSPRSTDTLSPGMQTFLFGYHMAGLRMDHRFYRSQLGDAATQMASLIIREGIGRVAPLVKLPGIRLLGDNISSLAVKLMKSKGRKGFSRDNLLFLIGSLPLPPQAREALTTFVTWTIPADFTIEKVSKGLTYTADRMGYGVCRDLYAATLGVIYESVDASKVSMVKEEGLGKLLSERQLASTVRDRIGQLWTFAHWAESR